MNAFHTSWLMETLVIVVLQLALVTHYWTWMSHVSTWGSIILFFLSTITFNSETWLVRSSSAAMCRLGRDVYSWWCLVVDSALIYSAVDMFWIHFMPQLRKYLNKNFHAMGNNNAFQRYSVKKTKRKMPLERRLP